MAGRQTGFYTMFSMKVMSLTLRVILAMMQAIIMFKLSMDSGRTLIILISFQMVYGKPYLVTILDLQVDDFF